MKNRELGKHYIREWRLHRKLSLRKLADRMEVEPGIPLTSHANIDRIEKGVQPYSQEILEALAVALEVTVLDLLSVDPTKNGEIVDLLNALKPEDRERAVRMLKSLLAA